MTRADKLQAIAAMIAQAITACSNKAAASEILQWIEKRSPRLAVKLEAEPAREVNVLAALERGLRAARSWSREGRPGPLYARLTPAAKQLEHALR